MRAKLSIALASVLVSALAATAPADAACKKFGFTVNDYGKEGPTNDAKNLLDKHIAEWAAQNGVSAYQTGKKSVSCELFLDVILFDEHTCTASANVCWGAGVKPNNNSGEQAAVTPDDAAAGNGEAPPAPVRKAEAMGIAPQQPAAAAPAAEAAAVDAAPTTPVEQIAAPAETPAASPAVPAAAAEATPPAATPPVTAVVETGALQANQPVPTPEKKAATGPSDKERAAAAAAAATAAAAAERAAMAAETAANAAKEAAAAAVAASAASKGPATVPPLDHASGVKPAHNE
jgi:hypothetical protein